MAIHHTQRTIYNCHYQNVLLVWQLIIKNTHQKNIRRTIKRTFPQSKTTATVLRQYFSQNFKWKITITLHLSEPTTPTIMLIWKNSIAAYNQFLNILRLFNVLPNFCFHHNWDVVQLLLINMVQTCCQAT